MRRATWWLLLACAPAAFAATDVRVNFTLNTTDPYGAPLQQTRTYWVYRPDNLPRTVTAPMILVMDGGVSSLLHRKADQAGFVVVSCTYTGNSSNGWSNDDPRIRGYEDYDYTDEVIRRVRAAENTSDTFMVGFSAGGHTSLAYACVRPNMLKAAASVDEFMGLTSNIPSGPLPILMMHGTADAAVSYTMAKDTLDAWRAVNGLMGAAPVTTYESSPLQPGHVSQATWSDDAGGLQAAFVTIVGGTHTYATSGIETGYDCTDGLWAFFSRFLTPASDAPAIVSQPADNMQFAGSPASFRAVATGAAPLSYQWQKNGVDIAGATSGWYTVPATAVADDGALYRAVVTNTSGSVASAAAKLTVKAASAGPGTDVQPSDQSVASGQPVTFTVAASGAGPFRYQWSENGVPVPGATGDTLQIPAAITWDSGAAYTVAVSGPQGSVTSNRATLAVARASGVPIILANPARFRTIPGQAASFSVSAWSLSPMAYQWQKGGFGVAMANIPGATDATYTIASPQLSDNGTVFRCVVANSAGSAVSADELLAVTAAAVPPTQIASLLQTSAQAEAPFSFTVASSGGTLPIVYSADPLPAGLSLDPDSGVISGTPLETGTYSIAIAGANKAGKVRGTLTLTVTVDPPPLSLDAWRSAVFGASATDPSIAGDDADPDGDGFTNLQEFYAGTNPLDPDSHP
jgi:poly(3-hydroxybutyrate) depolymerase